MGNNPSFYRLLPGAQPLELLAQRLIWSIPCYYWFDYLLKIELAGVLFSKIDALFLCVYLVH
ncbi:hypothetical protein I3679_002460 [Proteus mirabilis]|uniref:Uncharacterized protein n=1 Tax=Proteus mirabilis TaxID=584 RepID=A0ABD5LQI6_PROMI